MNYDGRVFHVRSNSDNGEVGGETLFRYRQSGDRLTGSYHGGEIAEGHLLGRVADDGTLSFCYHHVTTAGELRAGRCTSAPTRTDEGRLVMKERWQWLTGDRSRGTSELIEVDPGDMPHPSPHDASPHPGAE
jgi:hypothetical protein